MLLETNLNEKDAEYWKQNAQSYLKNVLEDPEKEQKPKKAKNIILFLGDGMSLTTVAATRMYLGDEKNSLSFEKFSHFGLSKVWKKNNFKYIIYKKKTSINFYCLLLFCSVTYECNIIKSKN